MITHNSFSVTLLDGLHEYLDSNQVMIVQTYNVNDVVYSGFKNIKNKIIVMIYMEYHTVYFLETIGKNNNYYIIIHNHDYPEIIKKKYNEHYTLIIDQSLYAFYVDKFKKTKFVHHNKRLHFLCLNNRAMADRQSLYYFFEKFSLREKSYFSYQGALDRAEFDSHDEIADVCTTGGTPWYLANLDLKKLNKNIPVAIPNDVCYTDQWSSLGDWSSGQDFYYYDTFCSIVFETYTGEKYPYFSEKIFKPIVFYHPFILHSSAGSLQILKDMGFRTFGEFWDESYDSLCGNQRLEAIFHLILEIANWSYEKINRVYNSMIPILEYNNNHFFHTLPKMYEERKPKLFEEIKHLVGIQGAK
jgi:hypothetical protein